MGCCIAIAFVIAIARRALLGPARPEVAFAPPARRAAPGETLPIPASPVVAHAGGGGLSLVLGAVAVTAALYAGVVAALRWTGVAVSTAAPPVGWAGRDVAVAGIGIVAAVVAAIRYDGPATGPGSALLWVGAAWFGLGLLDMHVFAVFEIAPGSVLANLVLHGLGPVAMAVGAVSWLARVRSEATAS